MKRRTILIVPSAAADIAQIRERLTLVASKSVADRFIDRIERRISSLEYASERGSIRHPRLGIRIIGILDTVAVAFKVEDDTVNILRVLYGGQSFKAPATDED